jgi:hypothetical protein
MKPIHVSSKSYEAPAPGTYKGTFKTIDEIETQKGDAYRWVFDDVENVSSGVISGLSDANSPATVKNRTGRWLAALAGRSIVDAAVDPTDYVGKKYLLIVNADGKLETFSKLD